MTENCEQKGCHGLAKLEQEVKDLRERNGSDHKEFREDIQDIRREEARQEERFDRIMDTLNDLKSDNKEVINKLSPLVHKVETLESDNKSVSGDVEELKSKPGKQWDSTVKQIIGLVVAALVGVILARLGLQ